MDEGGEFEVRKGEGENIMYQKHNTAYAPQF